MKLYGVVAVCVSWAWMAAVSQGMPNQPQPDLPLCNASQVVEADGRFDACAAKADADLQDESNWEQVCSVIDAKLSCLDEHKAPCLEDNVKQSVRFVFLRQHIELASRKKNAVLLENCATLKAFKSDYVRTVFGSDRCSYDDMLSIVDASNECNVKAQQQYQQASDQTETDQKAHLVASVCQLRRQVETCNQHLYDCMSPDKVQQDRHNWQQLEMVFKQSPNMEDFSFDTLC